MVAKVLAITSKFQAAGWWKGQNMRQRGHTNCLSKKIPKRVTMPHLAARKAKKYNLYSHRP
jgi:hypothetical protein